MDKLERYWQLPLCQVFVTGIQALTQGFGIEIEQALRVEVQVADDQCVLVARVPGQGQHHADIVARRRKASRHMHHGLQQPYLVQYLLLAAKLK
ncbi:hypothetical protein D3C76_682600 [compost metagenome]